ncbi:Uncharacterised protein [Salmonella enterica]|nr:Uncharacterised protein [Salmonella enterica]
MPGPQGLAGYGIKSLRDAVLLPAFNDVQRPAVGGEYRIAQRPVLFIKKKQPLTLGRDANTFNLPTGYARLFQQSGNGSGALLPELMHIAFGITGKRR